MEDITATIEKLKACARWAWAFRSTTSAPGYSSLGYLASSRCRRQNRPVLHHLDAQGTDTMTLGLDHDLARPRDAV